MTPLYLSVNDQAIKFHKRFLEKKKKILLENSLKNSEQKSNFSYCNLGWIVVR